MVLIQILLPLYGEEGRRISKATFRDASRVLAKKFGGVTAYTRAPAEGMWRKAAGRQLDRDDIVTLEVMASGVDRRFWKRRRRELAKQFRQEEIMVRAWAVKRL